MLTFWTMPWCLLFHNHPTFKYVNVNQFLYSPYLSIKRADASSGSGKPGTVPGAHSSKEPTLGTPHPRTKPAPRVYQHDAVVWTLAHFISIKNFTNLYIKGWCCQSLSIIFTSSFTVSARKYIYYIYTMKLPWKEAPHTHTNTASTENFLNLE